VITSIITSNIFIEIMGIFVAALLAFIFGQYIIRPKRCDLQRKECQKSMEMLIESQNEKRKQNRNQVNDSIGLIRSDLEDIEDRVEKMVERVDDIYVRRDAVIPRLDDIKDEVGELRKLMFKFLKLNGPGGE
jgi:uncharacterized membrane protein YgaE (UPF0421/DUF939 family)